MSQGRKLPRRFRHGANLFSRIFSSTVDPPLKTDLCRTPAIESPASAGTSSSTADIPATENTELSRLLV
jgi:hypothetical protein